MKKEREDKMEEECAGGRSRLHQAACHFDMQIRIQTLSAAVKQQDAVGDHICPDAACCFMSPLTSPCFLPPRVSLYSGKDAQCGQTQCDFVFLIDAHRVTVTFSAIMN
ncbi:hypothetical protein Pcinc_029492 [Petrolisthes cinctipes]|uniref:Uncharacterized protein n=1 Tax=Petrolisthes cinctipes TaxID=88211 RepID=A0AAE1F0V7_PETCI|nr:hypothetical protein Pcinc_029492 [Petrolisthes cinctipes]